jgi:hypothetical protein
MSIWPSLGTRLLKNMCSRTENQLKRNLLLTRKRSKDYNNLLLRLYRNASIKPTRKFESKGKSIVQYKLGKITEG